MKIAYIILAHNNQQHLNRLISQLTSDNSSFFIHIDSKVNLENFTSLTPENEKVHYVSNRVNGRWGDIGIVKATCNALVEIDQHQIEFDRIILLSGQDYPIKSNKEIETFFSDNLKIDFIEYTPFPVSELTFNGIHRIKHYSYNFFGRRQTYIPFKFNHGLNTKGKIINTALQLLNYLSPKRKTPYQLKHYYGSQWFNITGKSGKEIIKYINEHPLYFKFHKNSLLPDEMFFQTIILKIKNEDQIINNNKRLVIWEEGSSHPKIIDKQDLNLIKDSGAFFARKFKENSLVLDEIDNLILYELKKNI